MRCSNRTVGTGMWTTTLNVWSHGGKEIHRFLNEKSNSLWTIKQMASCMCWSLKGLWANSDILCSCTKHSISIHISEHRGHCHLGQPQKFAIVEKVQSNEGHMILLGKPMFCLPLISTSWLHRERGSKSTSTA